MYNKEVLAILLRTYGEEKTILFCEMEALKNKLMYEGCIKDGICEPNEFEFEKDWWKNNEKDLKSKFVKGKL